ncbi:unnamed protein product [Parascedosporium putredinis]|uniref:SGNH hydrolase-type esterase domain-containing protein n=1 Tax=Parascedosporium putredinis TaxID=1442378 RepID=A0A9P1H5F8_9PEZI|nr:unnamed protein product [Parascedosporium putredinis]CAI7999313.1 unnamed protein product [Parascedosporium putredinis]
MSRELKRPRRHFNTRHLLIGGDVSLRVLPLGDALTHGTPSNPDSYRAALRALLVADGNPVDYVGSSTSGTSPDLGSDNQVEASADVGVTTIADVQTAADAAVPSFKPNLVIINVGTNDCRRGADVSNSSAALLGLLKTTWTSIFATAVLTTLPPATPAEGSDGHDADLEACLLEINAQITELVAQQQAASRKVVLVDFRAEEGGVTPEDLTDAVAVGRTTAAPREMRARDAASRGWLEPPEELPEPSGDDDSSGGNSTGTGNQPGAGDGSTTAEMEKGSGNNSAGDDAANSAAARGLASTSRSCGASDCCYVDDVRAPELDARRPFSIFSFLSIPRITSTKPENTL